mgnify:CR=1 FL=1
MKLDLKNGTGQLPESRLEAKYLNMLKFFIIENEGILHWGI